MIGINIDTFHKNQNLPQVKPYKLLIWSLLLILAGMVTGCEKSNYSDYRNLLGSWISTDLVDTIEFTSDHDFNKMYSGMKDHFDYNLSTDSITIRYNGFLKILVQPTNHIFTLKTDQLIIDFRPNCYGFRGQKITFLRK